MKTLRKISVLTIFALIAASLSIASAAVILVSNSITTTIYPSQAVTLVNNGTSVFNGDTIRYTATLAQGMTDRVVSFKSGATVLAQITTVSRTATYDVLAVNVGADPITLTVNAETSSN